MRLPQTALALGLALALLAGCRSSPGTTTSLKDIPTAGTSVSAKAGAASSLEELPEGPRKPMGLEPPELLFGEPDEYPLPSRTMVPGHGRQKTIDRVVGRVNNDIITLSEVQELAQPVIARIPPDLPPERHDHEVRRVQNHVLDRIIDHRLQNQHAERMGVTVLAKELDEAVADVMARNHMTPEQFDALLAREGLTIEQYRKKLEEQIIRRRIYNFEIISKVQVSDADVQDFYLDHIKEFYPPDTVVLSQIFIALPVNGDEPARAAAHEKAERVLAALKRGEPFAEVARVQSEDPTKDRGGRLGRFAKGEMLLALDKVAFTMRTGEIRGPVATERGLHVIKVDKRWGDKPLPLERVRDKVMQHLLARKRNERYVEWMETLRGDAFIERVDLTKDGLDGG